MHGVSSVKVTIALCLCKCVESEGLHQNRSPPAQVRAAFGSFGPHAVCGMRLKPDLLLFRP